MTGKVRQVCIEERQYPVPGYCVPTYACPLHGYQSPSHLEGPVWCYEVEATDDIGRDYLAAVNFHKSEGRRQPPTIEGVTMANLIKTGAKDKAYVVSINTIGGEPKVAGVSLEANFDESKFGSTVIHINTSAPTKDEAAAEAMAFYLEEVNPKPQPLRGRTGVPTPGAGSLGVQQPQPATTDVTAQILAFLKAQPNVNAEALAGIESALLGSAQSADGDLEGGEEEDEYEDLESHFRMHQMDAGRYGVRDKIEVSYLWGKAGNIKTAKISPSVFVTILNNIEEAQAFAHENGLMELDEGEEPEEEEVIEASRPTPSLFNRSVPKTTQRTTTPAPPAVRTAPAVRIQRHQAR